MTLPPFAAVTRVCATAVVASATEANNIATLFSFFMVLLLGKKPQPRCVNTTFKVTITKNVKVIVPHVLTQATVIKSAPRRTKAQ